MKAVNEDSKGTQQMNVNEKGAGIRVLTDPCTFQVLTPDGILFLYERRPLVKLTLNLPALNLNLLQYFGIVGYGLNAL